MTYEGLRLKVLKLKRKLMVDRNRKAIGQSEFTIISNNCWGGMVYESYGLRKQSPTVGLFFVASDYIKFVTNLRGYLSAPLTFIRPEDTRWKDVEEVTGDGRFGSYPIGVLTCGDDSVEVFFLHYHSEQEAYEKWTRRCERVNWAHMLVKFNDQNGCTAQEIERFLALPYAHKVVFTCHEWEGIDDGQVVVIDQFPKGKSIRASFEPFGKTRRFDLHAMINSL